MTTEASHARTTTECGCGFSSASYLYTHRWHMHFSREFTDEEAQALTLGYWEDCWDEEAKDWHPEAVLGKVFRFTEARSTDLELVHFGHLEVGIRGRGKLATMDDADEAIAQETLTLMEKEK